MKEDAPGSPSDSPHDVPGSASDAPDDLLLQALFGFLLPPESGERIGLTITIILAICVFLQVAMCGCAGVALQAGSHMCCAGLTLQAP